MYIICMRCRSSSCNHISPAPFYMVWMCYYGQIIKGKKNCLMFNKLKQLAIALLVLLAGELVGFNAMESYQRELAQTAQLSLEDLYQEKMVKEDLIVLERFPPQLQEVRYARAGSLIYTNGVDSLYFVRADVIDGKKNYTLEDGHNKWYVFTKGNHFYISKVYERKQKKFLKFFT